MKLVYSDQYDLNLGDHVFPSVKYTLTKEKVLRDGVARAEDFVEPAAASDEDVALVHHRDYIRKLKTGTLSYVEKLRLEIPYSPELVRAVWLCAGGSILAGRLALQDSVAVNVGGGFHHACPDHGEGFCVLHDVAIAIRRLQKDAAIERAMTVDCDVHHGTALPKSSPATVPCSPFPSTRNGIIPTPSRPATSTSTCRTGLRTRSTLPNLSTDWINPWRDSSLM